VARLLALPRRAVVLAEDETHLNLLPHVRASWTLRGMRRAVVTPGKNRQVTVYGAIEVSTGEREYRLGRRCAADFIAFLRMLAGAFPHPPVIVVICDNDSIHHARASPGTWSATPGWNCCTAPATARTTSPSRSVLPQCELRRSPLAWLPGSLSVEVPIGVPSLVQLCRLW
jgi:hypothetical protein